MRELAIIALIIFTSAHGYGWIGTALGAVILVYGWDELK